MDEHVWFLQWQCEAEWYLAAASYFFLKSYEYLRVVEHIPFEFSVCKRHSNALYFFEINEWNFALKSPITGNFVAIVPLAYQDIVLEWSVTLNRSVNAKWLLYWFTLRKAVSHLCRWTALDDVEFDRRLRNLEDDGFAGKGILPFTWTGTDRPIDRPSELVRSAVLQTIDICIQVISAGAKA